MIMTTLLVMHNTTMKITIDCHNQSRQLPRRHDDDDDDDDNEDDEDDHDGYNQGGQLPRRHDPLLLRRDRLCSRVPPLPLHHL